MKLLYPRKLLPTIKICVQLPVAGGVQQPTPFHFANAILLISLYYSSQFFSLPFTVRMQERIEPCHVFLFIFHLFLVGLSITKFAVWVIPLALCCQIGLGGQHINELKNSSLWGSLIKMSFRDSFLCGATSQLLYACRLYSQFLHVPLHANHDLYQVFLLHVVCTQPCWWWYSCSLSSAYVPCRLPIATLPGSPCLRKDFVSWTVFSAENSLSVFIFTVDSRTLASLLLRKI